MPGFELLRLIGQGTAGQVWLAKHSTLGLLRAIKVVQRDGSVHHVAKDKELEGIKHFEPVSREDEGLVDITDVGSLPEQAGFYYAMELADDANGPTRSENPSNANRSGNRTSRPTAFGGEGSDQGQRMSAKKKAAAAAQDGKAAAASPNAGGGTSGTAQMDVQRYVPRTLAGEVSRRGRFSAQETIDLGLRLARTLDFLHSRKLVHRDIKPQNILFVGGKPKLADPGLMTLVGEHTTWCGTTGYIPPEGQGAAQADLYSLGKTLYVISTGLPPTSFPECPTDEGKRPDHAQWLLLNQVICRACENDPRRRYRDAGELRRDLEKVEKGKKLPVLRKKRVVAVSAVAVAAILVALQMRSPSERETVQMDDRFDSPTLNPTNWYAAHFDTNEGPGTTVEGWPPKVGRGVSRFENRVTSATDSGWNVHQDLWLARTSDLRKAGEARIEIDYRVSGTNGGMTVSMTGGLNLRRPDEFPGKTLFSPDGGLSPPLPPTSGKLTIELSPLGPAIVRSECPRENVGWWARGWRGLGRGIGGAESSPGTPVTLCDLSDLPAWHLQILSHASAAAGMNNSSSCVEIEHVRIVLVAHRTRLVGYVTNVVSGLGMSGILVRNRTTGDGCLTGRDGAYVVKAWPGDNELEVGGTNLTLRFGALAPSTAREGHVGHDLGLIREPPALGDALGVDQLDRAAEGCFGLRDGHALIVNHGQLVEAPLAGGAGRVIGTNRPPPSLTCVGQRVLAADSHRRAFLYELQLDGSWKKGARLPTEYAESIAFDGSDFWITQNDRAHGHGAALYRWNPETGVTVTVATDLPISSVAWYRGELWLLTKSGTVFEVDPRRAIEAGRVEPACLRNFETPCVMIASDGVNLWGKGPKERTLHRLYVP